MSIELESLKASHSGREVMYNLLFRTFIDSPNEEFYTMLEALTPNIKVLADELDDDRIKEGFAGISKFLQERAAVEGDAKAEYDLDTLRHYTRVLCLTDSVPTVESYYTSVEKLAMQEARDQVLKYYSDFGLKKLKNYNEQEDFISMELHFMSYMAKETAKTLDEGDMEKANKLTEAQYNFVKDHLNVWVDEFTERLGKFKESHRIHYPLAKFMCGFLKFDEEFLKELTEKE